jgi:hypothetical protein
MNFVTQHEIDNTSMLMPSGSNSAASSGNATDTNAMKSHGEPSTGGTSCGKQKRKKKRMDKEKFTSLSVACIKRLLPVGMNTFGGREQELVQLAKHKMIDVRRMFRFLLTFVTFDRTHEKNTIVLQLIIFY